MVKKKLVVSFSGGRTSAFMCKWLIDNLSHIFDFYFVFCNTGQEHEETLIFVDKCDKAFGLNLVWLEAVINPIYKKVTTHKIVNFETADRDGSVFEDMVKKFGLPNKSYPHCTRELKIRPIASWEKSIGLDSALWALGIRVDEPKRVRADRKYMYPLVHLTEVTREDVLNWWKKQDFDLNLPEHLGNCTWCFKKSLKKLLTLAKEETAIFDFPLRMETYYAGHGSHPEEGMSRAIFRENRSTVDILQMAQSEFNKFEDLNYEDCAEECGSVIPEDTEDE